MAYISASLSQERKFIIESPKKYPENYKNAQEKTLLPSTFSLVWGLVMVVVGAMVKNGYLWIDTKLSSKLFEIDTYLL